MESLQKRIDTLVQEKIEIQAYNPEWPEMFEEEKKHLLKCLPEDLVNRIEHFGSTAIPNLAAKPIIDMLVEVTSLDETNKRIVPVLTNQGYDYFWRPTRGDDVPPFYAWFIKRDARGNRTHHVHMIEHDFEHWDRLLFRDYLIAHPQLAREYETMKFRLMQQFPNDRVAYTEGKTDFISRITQLAKEYYKQG